MPNFKLVSEHTNDFGEVEFRSVSEFSAEVLDDVVMHIDMFLKGVGYCYNGEVQIVDNTPEQSPSEETCGGPGCCHNSYFFDTDRNR